MVNNYLKPLRGQTHYFPSNSFFKDINNSLDVSNELKKVNFYDILGTDVDTICEKIFKVKKSLGGFIGRDTKLGAQLFNKVSEVFILLFQKNIAQFKEALDELLSAIEYHRQTKEILVGIPLVFVYVFRLIRKIWIPILSIVTCIVLAICLFIFASRWLAGLFQSFGMSIDKNEIDLVIMGAIGLMYFFNIRKSKQ
jgi:hypothetical protein